VHPADPCSRLGHLQWCARGCLNKKFMGARSCWPGLMKMLDDLIKHLSARTALMTSPTMNMCIYDAACEVGKPSHRK
jgi:hypothetical protein